MRRGKISAILLVMESRPPAILCRGLRKTYEGKVEAVRGLDLEVRSGEFFGLLGPNGAGKTTTIEILEGLLEPTSGEVKVLGEPWRGRQMRLRQRIGISLQETRLSEKLTVLETLRLFRSFYWKGIEPEEAVARVDLEEKSRSQVGKLSGGQKQRLAVACALVGDPDLLFLDEPTTGLDPQSRRALWDVLRDFRARGRTILLTTHYMDEAERLCDRIAIVDEGRVIALGTPSELIAGVGGEHIIDIALEGNEAAPRHTAAEPDSFADLPSIRSVRVDWPEVRLAVEEPHVAIPALLERLRVRDLRLARLTTHHATLEDVFVKITGRHLRDGGEGKGNGNGNGNG
jgi:ABC-2 type transport system ATP-binding protein